jgi:hypothetical protein
METERTPEEIIAEVLGRWSVTDLREMSDKDLDRGLEQIGGDYRGLKVLRIGRSNVISFWDVESDSGQTYQVRRFKNFVWCSCLDHFFSKTVCRHIAYTTKDFSRRRAAEMDRAPYIKPETVKRSERIGNVRI